MTRAQIVAAACKRLGEESTDFKALIDAFFNDVLRDLAAYEALDALHQEATFDIVAGQEAYSTRTMAGLVSPQYPMKVLDITVPSWGTAGLLQRAANIDEFNLFRAVRVSDSGRPAMYLIYPNNQQVKLWPPADAANAAAAIGRMRYLAPPSFIGDAVELEQVREEDIETIVYGLIARGAPFRDETLLDVERAGDLYLAGRANMWGRTKNGRPGRVEPLDF